MAGTVLAILSKEGVVMVAEKVRGLQLDSRQHHANSQLILRSFDNRK